MKLLNTLIAVIALGVVLLVGATYKGVLPKEVQLGAGWYASGQNLLGSSSYLVRLPNQMVFADTTTTDAGLSDSGTVLTQLVETSGYNTVLLNFYLKPISTVSATSTVYIRQMGSLDGTNYYDLATTTTDLLTPTSTPMSLFPLGTRFYPPTSGTSTISIPFKTLGQRYTRFLMYADDLYADGTDGVRAWITAVKVDPVNR